MPKLESRELTIETPEGWRRVTYADLKDMHPPVSLSERFFPIPHEFVVENVMDAITAENLRLAESLFAVSGDEHRFLGIIDIRSREVPDDEKSWAVAFTNANDGTDGISIYGGCRVFACNTLAFHEELSVIKQHTEEAFTGLSAAIAASIKKLHEHWSINDDRAEAYKALSLTKESAHDIMCQSILEEVVAGREIASLLNLYHNPPKPQFKPRNLWSLYNCMSIILNTLKSGRVIDRTMQLHRLLDNIAKFTGKPSPYIQSSLL